MSDNASSSPLPADQESLLQAALTTGFSTAHIPLAITAASPETQAASYTAEPSITTESQSVTSAVESTPESEHAFGEWKEEYESNVSKWQQEGAIQREHAERVRKEWEERRARGEASIVAPEEFLGAHLAKAQSKQEGEWEAVEQSKLGQMNTGSSAAEGGQSLQSMESSQAVSGTDSLSLMESMSSAPVASEIEQPPARSQSRTSSVSKWDSMPSSLTSSYPSLSFPESNSPHVQVSKNQFDTSTPHDQYHAQEDPHRSAKPPASHAVFDSSLSTKTRAIALLGSLTINIVLPFINGVMLGFGEIFSENVLFRWFGWKKTLGRSSIGDVGLRDRRRH